MNSLVLLSYQTDESFWIVVSGVMLDLSVEQLCQSGSLRPLCFYLFNLNADNKLDIYYNDVSGKELGLIQVHGMDFTHSGNVHMVVSIFYNMAGIY